ncbi:MAG: hypothetical protein D6678_00875 [Zetaproteobacteria bacterium]|nr:MAG: hypothetical protein D6678_00875 [Zetaproteobacteria bacterium]
MWPALILLLGSLSACATHKAPVPLHQAQGKTPKVIGLPTFDVSRKLDVRRENPMYAIIGLSARLVQQMVQEYHRVEYARANPKLHRECLARLRNRIKRRLRHLGYRVRDLKMNYWQAQAAYRKGAPELRGVDALLHVQIKRFGYYSASPFKPYRPGMIVAADLVSTKSRRTIASNVYNVGYDPEDVPKLELGIDYMTTIHVAERRFFYRNYDELIAHARASAKALRFIASVAAESIAGDMRIRSGQFMLARRR